MFKITLGALLASTISVFLPVKKQRLFLAGAVLIVFVAIEIIFIANGGDK